MRKTSLSRRRTSSSSHQAFPSTERSSGSPAEGAVGAAMTRAARRLPRMFHIYNKMHLLEHS